MPRRATPRQVTAQLILNREPTDASASRPTHCRIVVAMSGDDVHHIGYTRDSDGYAYTTLCHLLLMPAAPIADLPLEFDAELVRQARAAAYKLMRCGECFGVAATGTGAGPAEDEPAGPGYLVRINHRTTTPHIVELTNDKRLPSRTLCGDYAEGLMELSVLLPQGVLTSEEVAAFAARDLTCCKNCARAAGTPSAMANYLRAHGGAEVAGLLYGDGDSHADFDLDIDTEEEFGIDSDL